MGSTVMDTDTLKAKFPIGVTVKVGGMHGTFKVIGYGKDGSVQMYGGTAGHGSTRSIMPHRVRKVKAT